MSFRRGVLVALGAAFALACASSRRGPGAGWVLLGERAVSDRIDHDRIGVTGARGDFTAIKLTVDRAAVDFRRVVVHYANGASQPIEVRNTIGAGGETRAIDLRAGDRVIRNVEFWYDANTGRGRRGVVRLYGRP